MTYFWVVFTKRNDKGDVHQGRPLGGTIKAISSGEALKLAEQYGEPMSAHVLPYPASPKLNCEGDGFPAFCFSPDTCKGHSSCPRGYACSE